MAFKSRHRTRLAIPTKLDGVAQLVADRPPDNSTFDIDIHPLSDIGHSMRRLIFGLIDKFRKGRHV